MGYDATDRLYELAEKFINEHKITSGVKVYSAVTMAAALDFIRDVCEVVGYDDTFDYY